MRSIFEVLNTSQWLKNEPEINIRSLSQVSLVVCGGGRALARKHNKWCEGRNRKVDILGDKTQCTKIVIPASLIKATALDHTWGQFWICRPLHNVCGCQALLCWCFTARAHFWATFSLHKSPQFKASKSNISLRGLRLQLRFIVDYKRIPIRGKKCGILKK